MRNFPLSIFEAAAALRAGTFTSSELILETQDRANALDPQLGAYLVRFDEQALAAAALADAELAVGRDRGPLHGIPVGVKDIIAVKEGSTSAQSLVLDQSWGAGRDAPVIRRLRDAGAVITGKLSTMEFACGMPDSSKPFPLPRNPWDVTTWPGGSSSGSGVAVAAGLVLAGLGSDTGGSIRIPAAFCGVSGLMPTFGRVPKSGCVPLGFSLDHIGPLARTARDCAAVLASIAGYESSDPSCADRPVPDFLANLDGALAGVSIGVDYVNHTPDDADPAVASCLKAALTVLADAGARIVEMTLPYYAETVAAGAVTMYAEALAYHRNDIINRGHDYSSGTCFFAAQGALISGADYVQAQRVRRAAQLALNRVFSDVAVVVSPTTAGGAPAYDTFLDRPDAILDVARTVFTTYWDSVGNPVLAVPMGFSDGGLPISLQIAGRPFDEASVLRVGDAFQQRTDWHARVPAMAGVTLSCD